MENYVTNSFQSVQEKVNDECVRYLNVKIGEPIIYNFATIQHPTPISVYLKCESKKFFN